MIKVNDQLTCSNNRKSKEKLKERWDIGWLPNHDIDTNASPNKNSNIAFIDKHKAKRKVKENKAMNLATMHHLITKVFFFFFPP